MRLPIGPALLCLAVLTPAMATDSPPSDCKLSYSLTEWSVVFKHAEGRGEVTCKGAAPMKVVLTADGAGTTVGKFRIENAEGAFTGVTSIDDIPGAYAVGEAGFGLTKARDVQLLTKGGVGLTLLGIGQGTTMGVSVGRMTITAEK